MKICDKCSVANDDKAVFCTGCGAVLPNDREENLQESAVSENPVNYQANEAPAQQSATSQAQSPYAQVNPAYSQGSSPYVQPVYSQPAQPQMPYSPQYGYISENMLPPEYRPVTIGQYIGYTILFGLPFIGIIMLFITAFGGDKSISLRNYAKYYLIMYAIGIVMVFVVFLFAGLFSASMY